VKRTIVHAVFDAAVDYAYDKLRERLRRRLPDTDNAMEDLVAYLDLVHRLFGPRVSLHSYVDAGGRTNITVECRNCQRRNRLTRGLENARCGNCKTPLVVTGGVN
jgi:hypothetical protein